MDLIDSKFRVRVTVGDIAAAMEDWETEDVGKFVGVLLFGVNSYSARDFLKEKPSLPPEELCPATLNALLTGLYGYAHELAKPVLEVRP